MFFSLQVINIDVFLVRTEHISQPHFQFITNFDEDNELLFEQRSIRLGRINQSFS